MPSYGPVVSRFLSRQIGGDAEVSCLSLRSLPFDTEPAERIPKRRLTKSTAGCEMPAWPGGPCPKCGEEMPQNSVQCQSCRCLLKATTSDRAKSVLEYLKLQEISNVVEAPVAGYHVQCPHCEEELRINRKYVGMAVACKHCSGQFQLDVTSSRIRTKAFYVGCPHCDKELRVAPKYIGQNVACKFCGGHVKIVPAKQAVAPAAPAAKAKIERSPAAEKVVRRR